MKEDERADAVSQVEGYRIFNFRGKLKVIAVPFIEGRHYPSEQGTTTAAAASQENARQRICP
jgi:hypothetical protein